MFPLLKLKPLVVFTESCVGVVGAQVISIGITIIDLVRGNEIFQSCRFYEPRTPTLVHFSRTTRFRDNLAGIQTNDSKKPRRPVLNKYQVCIYIYRLVSQISSRLCWSKKKEEGKGRKKRIPSHPFPPESKHRPGNKVATFSLNKATSSI